MTCTTRLLYFDMEREKRQYEAMAGGAVTNAMGGGRTEKSVAAEYW